MKIFMDNAGRSWAVSVNGTAIKRVKGLTGENIYDLLDEGLSDLAKFLDDPLRFFDVLYALCKDEADRAGVTDEDFGRAMGGDSYKQAQDAFLFELAEFVPDPKKRAALHEIIAAARRVQDRMIELGMARLETFDPEAQAREILGPRETARPSTGGTGGTNGSPGTVPASSGSTPARSPSAS